MPICIEYLAIFKRTDSFCKDAASFIRLLEVDEEIRVNGGEVRFQGHPTCRLLLSGGEIAARGQRYFHLHFTWDGDPDGDSSALDRFLSLLKKVRGVVAQAKGDTEVLWSDLSTHYAQKAYPLIHGIENLMRRLIANFMLVTVGREWAQETLPKAVDEAVRNSKRKEDAPDYLNVLHTVDFCHLGDFLFAPYSKRTVSDLYTALKDAKSPADVQALQEFVPVSNWKRYFASIVSCDDGYLKTRWDKLYPLRCKVAHNALMTAEDLAEIERLVGEVKPKLQDAIAKLSKVAVPASEAELVADRAAQTVNPSIADFLAGWQQLESMVTRRLARREPIAPRMPTSQDLLRHGILGANWIDAFEEVRTIRNALVHGPLSDVTAEQVVDGMVLLRELHLAVETSHYVDYLKDLSEDDRHDAISYKIIETSHELLDTEEVSSEMAMTNAFDWDVDEWQIEEVTFDDDPDTCRVRFSFGATGQQDTERMFCGDRIDGEAVAIIDAQGNVLYEVDYAQLAHDDEPDFDEEPVEQQ